MNLNKLQRYNLYKSTAPSNKSFLGGYDWIKGLPSSSAYTKLLIQLTSAQILDSSAVGSSLTTTAIISQNPDWNGYYMLDTSNIASLSGPSGSLFSLGTQDFTVESILMIVGNCSQTVGDGGRIIGNERGGAEGWGLNVSSAGPNQFPNGFQFYSQMTPTLTYNFALQQNVVYHIAASRKNGVLRLFLDGALVATNSSFAYNITYSGNLHGFSRGDNYNAAIRAKIYAIRIVIGQSLYDSTFNKNLNPFVLV